MINLRSQTHSATHAPNERRIVASCLRRLTLATRLLVCSSSKIATVDEVLSAAAEDAESQLLPSAQRSSHEDAGECASASVNAIAPSTKDVEPNFLGRRIVSRLVKNLSRTRESTETAVLSIGSGISSLFDLAVGNNEAATASLRKVVGNDQSDAPVDADSDSQPIRELIADQRQSIDLFLKKANGYFREQRTHAEKSWDSFQHVAKCVSEIEAIASNSKVLAINAKIESARLGSDGAAFGVVSDHLTEFSASIQQVNRTIDNSIGMMREVIEYSRDAAMTIETDLKSFSEQLATDVERVESQTDALTQAMSSTLDQIAESTTQMVDHSRSVLSNLQFQDPMMQELKKAEHDVNKLQTLLETGVCDDTDLAELDEAVGHDGTLEREPGLVELF